MGSLLSDVLRSICVENGWVYAVLWKLNCQNPMILMWEDAYYEGGVHMDDSFSVFRSQPFVSGQGEIFVNERKPGRAKFCTNDKLGMLVEKMKDQLHVVGRGIVGHVALMGTHKWIYQDTYINEGYACSSTVYGTPFENFADWHGQFAAGIQTVAVISVSPYGVLQCGSIQKMSETLSFVNHLKLMFMQFEGIETPAFEIAPVTPCLFQKLYMVNEADVYANDASNNFCVKEEGPFPSVDEIPGELLVGHHSSPFSTVLGTHESHSNLHGVIYGDACVVSSVPRSNITANEADVDSFIPKALLSINSNIAPSCHMETVSSRGDPEANSIASMHLNQYPSQRSDTLYSTSMGTSIGTTIDQNFDSLVSLNCAHGLIVPSEVSSSVHSINGVVDPMNGFCEALYTDSSVVWNSMHREPSDPPHNDRYQYENSVSVPLSSAVNDSKTCDIHSSCSRLQLTRPSNESEIQCMAGSTDSDLFQAIGSSFSASFLDKCDSFKRELSKIMPEFMPNTVVNDIQQMPKGNFQPIKIEPEASNSLIVTAGGEISETNKPINNSLDRLPLDTQISNSQTGYKSTILKLKSVEDSGTGSGFSSFISDSNAGPMSNMLNDVQIDTSCFSESRTDDLLDAIVSSVQSYTNRSCNKCISANTLLGGVCSSNSSDDKLDVVAGLSPYPTKSDMVTPNYCSLSEGSASKNGAGSLTDGTSKSQASFRMDDVPSVKHDDTRMPHTGMSEESPKSKQKRPKPGESTRPRPKDRQLIQDRVKELREIVPNGAKCSIDALLERTIKHMLFLQSVTKHADKLKNTGKSKLISKDGAWPLLLKDNFGGGATWAFEVGSKSMICPIIVEDLNVPHQMLVEMLCEERGFFLEIAELIRQMGLTILKGVMEMREDKIWAHFAVEANRDISRMEVFMSLVHLLEQISNSTTPKDTGSKIPVS